MCRRRAVGYTPYDVVPVTGSVRLVYLGTPSDAVPPLRALVDAGHEVALVVTQPDRRRSRGAGSDPSPVRVAAEELGLPVRTPVKAREVVDDVRASGAELGVVVAFGQLLPVSLLEALPLGLRERALLAAAALARRGAGRARDPRRRHRDRRVRDAARSRARHRPGVRVAASPDRTARDGGRAARPPGRGRHAVARRAGSRRSPRASPCRRSASRRTRRS